MKTSNSDLVELLELRRKKLDQEEVKKETFTSKIAGLQSDIKRLSIKLTQKFYEENKPITIDLGDCKIQFLPEYMDNPFGIFHPEINRMQEELFELKGEYGKWLDKRVKSYRVINKLVDYLGQKDFMVNGFLIELVNDFVGGIKLREEYMDFINELWPKWLDV